MPVRFNRDEPNLKPPAPDSLDARIWNDRENLVYDQLCQELDVEIKIGDKGKRNFSFRSFTEKLWNAYDTNSDLWHKRIRPGRIWGVIMAAQELFGVKTVYLFATNQPHWDDTIFLLEILQKWFKQEGYDLRIEPRIISNAVEQDVLFQDYYEFFNQFFSKSQRSGEEAEIDEETEILISTKGGTGQMQTALRMQAMASNFRFQANLEPQLSVATVLAGKPSSCKVGVYWQYARSQKYQAVKLLLNNRWDFDGAEQILRDWQLFLDRLVERKIADPEVTTGNQQLEQVIAALQIAKTWLNLDDRSARALLEQHSQIAQALGLAALMADRRSSKLLNLYTQCRILWQLDEVANFLPRMGSFCEAVTDQVIRRLLGQSNAVDRKWYVCKERVEAEWGRPVWDSFAEVERSKNNNFNPKKRKDSSTWCNISGRYSKRNFAQAVVDHQPDSTVSESWTILLDLLQQLDYWADKRNELIHGAEGISKSEMNSAYREEIEKQNAATIKKKTPSPKQRSTSEPKTQPPALPSCCAPDQILNVMEDLCRNPLLDLNLNQYSCYIGNHTRYYLYSQIREYVLAQFM